MAKSWLYRYKCTSYKIAKQNEHFKIWNPYSHIIFQYIWILMPLSLVRVFSMTPDTSSLTSASFFPGALLMSWFDNLMIVVVVMMVDDDEIFRYHGWELWIMIIFWSEELVYRRQYRECGTKSQETSSPHKAARQGIREWDEQEPWRSGSKLPDRIFWVWRNKAETSWETTFAARCFRWYWTGTKQWRKPEPDQRSNRVPWFGNFVVGPSVFFWHILATCTPPCE